MLCCFVVQEFEAEGIDTTLVSYESNEALISLLMGNPVGLLNLVDEESRFPAASDKSLIQKLHLHCNSSEGEGFTQVQVFFLNSDFTC